MLPVVKPDRSDHQREEPKADTEAASDCLSEARPDTHVSETGRDTPDPDLPGSEAISQTEDKLSEQFLTDEIREPVETQTDPDNITESVESTSVAAKSEPPVTTEENKFQTPVRGTSRTRTGSGSAGAGNKLFICGLPGVGKTCVISRWLDGEFPENVKPSRGCPFRSVNLEGEDHDLVKVSIYETPKEKFAMHARNTLGIIFTYDITNAASLDYLGELVELFKAIPHRENCMVYVLGNKLDLADERGVSEASVAEVFDGLNAQFFEASSMTGEGCETLHHAIEQAAFP